MLKNYKTLKEFKFRLRYFPRFIGIIYRLKDYTLFKYWFWKFEVGKSVVQNLLSIIKQENMQIDSYWKKNPFICMPLFIGFLFILIICMQFLMILLPVMVLCPSPPVRVFYAAFNVILPQVKFSSSYWNWNN